MIDNQWVAPKWMVPLLLICKRSKSLVKSSSSLSYLFETERTKNSRWRSHFWKSLVVVPVAAVAVVADAYARQRKQSLYLH